MPFSSLASARLGRKTIGVESLRSVFRVSEGYGNLAGVIEACLDSVTLIGTLLGLAWYWEDRIAPSYLILAVVVFALTFPGAPRLNKGLLKVLRDIVLTWLVVFGLLALFGTSRRLDLYFDHDAMMMWMWIAPTLQFGAHCVFRALVPWLVDHRGEPQRAVIAGKNSQGIALAQEMQRDAYCGTRMLGFFDDRNPERLPKDAEHAVLGSLPDLPRYCAEHRVGKIYLSLPMATQPRIVQLLDGLRDTTASVYFVPDIFVTDLIQGRMGSVGNMPVIGVCETPFAGIDGIVKRMADLVLASVILLCCLPLLLIIAAAVKVSSPGPVIFRQRRYGLDGREIVVFKFRSMAVCEDGAEIRQAQKNDRRVTRVGAFLRKTSLDELPQFVNVLKGDMSIVGPRPHAVAHNELYRKLISGYMIRHKVKPGITGWAQVNGFRGETESLEKMKGRIDFDLDYLRNWSPLLDMKIIVKTVWTVLKDQSAY